MPKGADTPDDLPPLTGALEGARYQRLLRDRPGYVVCEIRLHDKPAYLKLFHHGAAAHTVREAEARLLDAARALGQQSDAVALPLQALPDQGILVLEAAPGLPSAEVLAHANADRRAFLLTRIGIWLERLTAPTREVGTFGPRFWLGMAEDRFAEAEGDWIDRDLVGALLAQMRHETPRLRGAQVLRAVAHGDLTPENIFWDDETGRMTGIDMQSRAVIPVTLDVARLLAWLQSRRDGPAPRTVDGVAAADYQALVAVPGLLTPDQLPILRFLIAVNLQGYYLRCPRHLKRRGVLAAAMQDWIRQAP